MTEERPQNSRAADQGLKAVATQAALAAGTGVWDWIDKRRIIARIVILLTIWLTFRVVDWAMNLPYDLDHRSGTDIALIQAAVLGPWGLLQAAMFRFYTQAIGGLENGVNKLG
jgi:hypothetical protein